MKTDGHDPEATDSRQCFVELLSDNQNRLFGFLYSHVLNMADAEDLYQQVAMLLWTKFDQFEPGTNFGGWAMRVADFTIKNFMRSKRRSKVYFNDEVMQRVISHHAAMPHEESTLRTEALRGCLKKVSSADTKLLELRYAADTKIKDIALEQGRSTGAMYTALSRIRRNLLDCIERTLNIQTTS